MLRHSYFSKFKYMLQLILKEYLQLSGRIVSYEMIVIAFLYVRTELWTLTSCQIIILLICTGTILTIALGNTNKSLVLLIQDALYWDGVQNMVPQNLSRSIFQTKRSQASTERTFWPSETGHKTLMWEVPSYTWNKEASLYQKMEWCREESEAGLTHFPPVYYP